MVWQHLYLVEASTHIHYGEEFTSLYSVKDVLRYGHGVPVLLSFQIKHVVGPTHSSIAMVAIGILHDGK